MNVYTNTLFDGFWPVGVAAIVVATSPEEAALLLEIELQERGLPPQTIDPAGFVLVDMHDPAAIILKDGQY